MISGRKMFGSQPTSMEAAADKCMVTCPNIASLVRSSVRFPRILGSLSLTVGSKVGVVAR